jgi:hypothetical protein
VSKLARQRSLDDSHELHKDYIEGVRVQLLGYVQMRVVEANVLCRGMLNEIGQENVKERDEAGVGRFKA